MTHETYIPIGISQQGCLPRLFTALESLLKEREFLDINKEKHHIEFLGNSELSELMIEILENCYSLGRIDKAETRLSIGRNLDFEAVQRALKIIKEARPSNYTHTFTGGEKRSIDVKELLNKIETELERLKSHAKKYGIADTLLAMEVFFDHWIDEVLMAFPGRRVVFQDLYKLLLDKIDHMDADEVLLLWGRLNSLFGMDRIRPGFIRYEGLCDDAFFSKTNDLDVLRGRIARFICEYRPRTIRKMIRDGITSHPIGLIGVGRLLAGCDGQSVDLISNSDVMIVRSASHMAALYEIVTGFDVQHLAVSIGMNTSSVVFSGEYFNSFKSVLTKAKREFLGQILLETSKRLIQYVGLRADLSEGIESALWRYKLGQEVICPQRNLAMINMKEIKLQNELCKFLLERGIFAFGKSFGRSQIDLFTDTIGGESFIIEVKYYPKTVTVKNIESAFVQLESYMSQNAQPRGVLAIYNFSNTLIDAVRSWIGRRIWVIPFNLCSAPPSKRKTCIKILESTRKGQMVDIIKVG